MTLEIALRAPTLERLAETALAEHALVEKTAATAVEHAIRAGEALLEAKRQIPVGEWETWLGNLFPTKGLSMPRLYMRLARFADDVRAENPPTIVAARRVLAGGPYQTIDPRLTQEARKMRQQGATYTKIADRLGVAVSTAHKWSDPKMAERRTAHQRAQTVKAKRALAMEERAKSAKAAGGDIGNGYSFVRRALQTLDAASVTNPRARKALNEAIHRLYDAEELIGHAIRNAEVES